MGAIGGNSGGASWLDSPAASARRHVLVMAGVAEPPWLDLPDAPGVAVFEAADERATLIATTASLRGLARRRLGGETREPEAEVRPAANYRAITERVIGIEAASSLEADLIYLHEARERMPRTHQVVSERWRPWFVHVDTDAEHPQWTKTNLSGLVMARSASRAVGSARGDSPRLDPAHLIGPIADKDAAGRLIEKTIDAFDLCRYHHLLVMSPRATACAYKEMGRCAAPCDGSEPMESYRARVREAVEFLCGRRPELLDDIELQMRTAGASGQFEAAAALRQQLERTRGLVSGGFAHLARLNDWRLVIVMPERGGAKGSARLLALAGGRIGVLGTCDAADGAGMLNMARAAMDACDKGGQIEPTPGQMDTIAAVSRWLHTSKTRRRGEAVSVHDGADAAELGARLAAAAASVWKGRPRLAEVEERGLEVLNDRAAAESDTGTTERGGRAEAGV